MLYFHMIFKLELTEEIRVIFQLYNLKRRVYQSNFGQRLFIYAFIDCLINN